MAKHIDDVEDCVGIAVARNNKIEHLVTADKSLCNRYKNEHTLILID